MNQSTNSEGVIKFNLDYQPTGPLPWETCRMLDQWRTLLFRLGLTGVDPERYGGLAFGNVSQRVEARRFIVSGSQTGGIPRLNPAHYSLVDDWNLDEYWMAVQGPILPSSEALTHAAIYEADPRITAVLHVHSPEIWLNASALGLPATAPDIDYGTREMAQAAAALLDARSPGLIVMAGHQDGVLAVGTRVDKAAQALIQTLAAALSPGSS